ncbi:MAG: DNA polymerase I [Microgenomates bacterium OLB23]|nr:MAG: DNA polymerase I [Microgenomates bacterium OLB23]
MKKLLIIDGNALMHRAFHALPDFSREDGVPTNAVYGFASVLHKVRQNLQANHVVVCFDHPAPTFRDALFKEYRAQRPKTDDGLITQFPIVREFLTAAGIVHIEKEGFEADDLIAVVAKKAEQENYTTVILTGDKDIFQLVSAKTFVLTPQISAHKEGTLYDVQKVQEKFGVDPMHIPDYKALVGDPSDNYKGVPGIGPKAALDLLNKYKTIENIYSHIHELSGTKLYDLLKSYKEDALLAKQLAVLVHEVDGIDIELDDTEFHEYNEALRSFFEAYQIKSLHNRFFWAADTKKHTTSCKNT